MKFHRFYSFFWNWSIDRKHRWLFELFWNYKCISFTNGEQPLTAGDLWQAGVVHEK